MNGIALMLLASVSFTVNDAALKLALAGMPYGQAVTVRGIVSCTLVFGFAFLKVGIKAIVWNDPRGQIESTLWFVATSFLFIYALPQLEFAVAITAVYTAPLFWVVLARVALGEKISGIKITATHLGFVGVALTAGVNEKIEWPIVLPIASALCTAIRDIKLRTLLRTENSFSILTTHQAGLTIFGAFFALSEAAPSIAPSAVSYGFAAVASLGGVLGVHFTLAAFRVAEVSTVTAYRYSAVIWAALVGYLLFGNRIEFGQMIGMALVVISGILIAVETRMSKPKTVT